MAPHDLGLLPPRRRRAVLDFPFATINVVLLLLFFFVVTGSIVGGNEGQVAAPEVERPTSGRLPRPLLAIDRQGALFLDDVPVARDDLVARARAALDAAGAASPPLAVVADRAYSGGAFLLLVQSLRSAGIPVRIVMRDAG